MKPLSNRGSDSQLLRDLMEIAFKGSVPDPVLSLLPGRPSLNRFAGAPILTFGGDARAYVARVNDPGFLDRVRKCFPDPVLAAFFRSAPEVRWMIDTDGLEATAFLDDLQDHPKHAQGPRGLTAMCATLRVPDHQRGHVTRHDVVPVDFLDGAWKGRLQDAASTGLKGLWGIRWVDDAVSGLLCVNEDRWQGGGVEGSGAWLDGFREPRWLAIRSLAASAGYVAYPDAIEIRPDGRWDVTVGLVANHGGDS